MSGHPTDPQSVIRRLVEASNVGDVETYIGLHAVNFENFNRSAGPLGMRRIYESIHTAFPDWHNKIEAIFGSDTEVACRVTATGTHLGVPEFAAIFGGILANRQPTGRRVSVGQIHLYRVIDGLITTHWAVRDDLTMLRQITGEAEVE